MKHLHSRLARVLLSLPLVLLAWALFSLAGSLAADPQDKPYSLYGSVTLDGAPLPQALPVTASVNGQPLVSQDTFEDTDGSVYRIDMPGDVVGTAPVEGGQDGQTVTLSFGASEAPVQATWTRGQVQRLDIDLTSGADLGMTITASPDPVQPGQPLTYTLTADNPSELDAQGVVLELQVADGLSLISAQDGGNEATPHVIRWPARLMASQDSFQTQATFEVAPTFAAGIEILPATAEVAHDGSGGIDPEPADNSATLATDLDAAPDLLLAVDDGQNQVAPGDTFSYTLTVTNQGNQDAAASLLSNALPDGVTFLTASDDGIESPPGTLTWPTFDLAVGDTVTRQWTLRFDGVDGATELINTAAVTPGNGPDAQPTNNQASDVNDVAQRVDLEARSIDPSLLVTHPITTQASGSVAVRVGNLGNGDLADPFDITVFEDRDGDGSLGVGDNVLGQQTVTGGVPAGGHLDIAVPLDSELLFLGNRLYAWVDSGELVAEGNEDNNVTHSAEGCLAEPTVGDFQPVLELHWPTDVGDIQEPISKESLSTPIVVQLTDDNGDGSINANDVPDIVFVTANYVNFDLQPAMQLRAISGDDGREIFSVYENTTQFLRFAPAGLAAGDLDGDGNPEIIVSTPSPMFAGLEGFSNHLSAYNRFGQLQWVSDAFVTHPANTSTTDRDHPTLADLDGDGFSEIVVGANVFDRYGNLLWSGTGGQAYQSARNADGPDSGAISLVADLDMDGSPEVVTGNTAYRADGTIYWQTADADGYPAVGNFDADDYPEIVVVARGQVRLYEHDGALIWGPVDLPGTGAEPGGAPTVADFDGDGAAEIGVAGTTQYAVFEGDGSVKWQRTVQDDTSGMTGSTVFDLDGDGRYEVIYRDETDLRVYRGEDGTVLFEHPLSSFTSNEQPVVADVDGDGRAEIVVTSDLVGQINSGIPVRTFGLMVFGDANDNWIGTRGLWNQHAYSYDNVDDDGTIPVQPAASWLTHNTFRANLAPEEGAFSASNLTVSRLAVDLADYPQLTFSVRVGNGGLTSSPAGIPVAFYDGAPENGGQLLGVERVTTSLAPGQFMDLTLAGTSSSFGAAQLVTVVGDDGAGGGGLRECLLDDNRQTLDYSTDPVGLIVTVSDGAEAIRPGDATTYLVTASNGSLFQRDGVTVSLPLPPYTSLVSISDGGSLDGGVIVWPAAPLTGGEVVQRSVTLAVNTDIPLSETAVTVTVTVADDGVHGDDPSPANNVAQDVNGVLTVRADAGGPYSGDEGHELVFDASGSSDRDGTIASYAWDLDNDGVFDDGSGVTAGRSYDDNGTYTIAVQVTDDSGETDLATATVTVINAVPSVTAGADVTITEGGSVDLAATYSDSGSADTHSANVDWGDGTLSSVTANAGTLEANQTFADDGTYPVEVCVTDDDGAQACDTFTVTVENSDPVLMAADREINFNENWNSETLPGDPAEWRVESANRVRQRANAAPTVFYGPFLSTGIVFEGTVRINTQRDDDLVGFVLGFEPGDFQNLDADYLVIDWKDDSQLTSLNIEGREGLAISRVSGIPTFSELFGHVDWEAATTGGVEELQRGFNLGTEGWRIYRDYTFTIEASATRVRVFVNGVLELDVSGDFNFGTGRIGFYNLSQEQVIYRALSSEGISSVEGSLASFSVPFSDAGVLDTHTASIDWKDGSLGEGIITSVDGSGTVDGNHLYADNGDYEIEICIEDDDLGQACGNKTLEVLNLPPVVDAGDDRAAFSADGLNVDVAYTDPGVLDTHTGTIDWGDGSLPASLTLTGSGGQGTANAFHAYAAEGTYPVEVCVTDNDGDTGCDQFDVTWLDPRLDLKLRSSSDRQVIRPDEMVDLQVEVENVGSLDTSGVEITLQLPDHFHFVSADGSGTYDDAARRVTWTEPSLLIGDTLQRLVTLQADTAPPIASTVDAVFTVADDGAQGVDVTPTDNSDSVSLVLWNQTAPVVNLSLRAVAADAEIAEGSALELTAHLDAGASPLLTEVTLDWGDGTQESLPWTTGPDGAEVVTQHTYVDDGDYPIQVCVRDELDVEGCGQLTAEVQNLPATLFNDVGLDLTQWQSEYYPFSGNGVDPPIWQVSPGGREVKQLKNTPPSLFYGDFGSFGNNLETSIRVDENEVDEDFIGFALSFEPGDTSNPNAEYFVIDWKQVNQGGARAGLRAYRVVGVPGSEDFWERRSTDNSPGHIEPIMSGYRFGSVGWNHGQTYRFRFEFGPFKLKVWVDDELEIEFYAPFRDGRFAFYNHSQSNVTYSGVRGTRLQVDEGSPLSIDMHYRDPGVLDVHTGTLRWGDGTVTAATTDTVDGVGVLLGDHVYGDNGDATVTACIQDDDGDEHCNQLEVGIRNVAPVVVAGDTFDVFRGILSGFDLATYTDAGVLDTHTATVDWGDGTSSDAVAMDGQVQGSHAYAVSGTYTATVCVNDDDGDTACDTATVVVGSGPPILNLSKVDVLLDDTIGDGLAGRGDVLGYQLVLTNEGEGEALEVTVQDVLPPWLTLVEGSVQSSMGTIISLDPFTVDIGPFASGASATVDFAVTLGDDLPFELEQLSNQALVTQLALPSVLSDDPDTAESNDPTWTPLAPSDATVLCEVESFDGPLDDSWTFTYLGDGSDGQAEVSGGRLQLSGNGSSLFRSGDHGSFLYRELPGDENFRVEVDVTGFPLDQGGDVRKTALMLRSGTGTYDPRVMVTFVPHFPDPAGTGVQFEFRAQVGNDGSEVANTVFAVSMPARLAIEKRGNVYTVLYSDDGGTTWSIPTGVPHQGSVEVDLGSTLLAGVAVSSYDPQTLFTAELDDFAVCRPNEGGPFQPQPKTCSDLPVDMVYLLDVSGSMTADMPDGAAMLSRLEAAQLAIAEVHGRLQADADGSRAALVTFAGFRTPEENLSSGAQVVSGLTSDLGSVLGDVQALDVTEIQSGDTSPLAIALGVARQLLQDTGDPGHQQGLMLLTDGIPNIDGEGRGPDGYELVELQAIYLDDGRGRYRAWSDVAWSGGFNGLLGTFDGEPLADAMVELERLAQSLPDLRLYGLGLEGSGTGLGTFNGDLLHYGAYVSGGRSFVVGDTTSLLAATDALTAHLRCEDQGTGSIGDRVWFDENADGSQNDGEPGLSDVTIDLFDGEGFHREQVITGSGGSYLFETLPADTYRVEVHPGSLPVDIDVPTWDVDGTASMDHAQVPLADGETTLDVDFGYAGSTSEPPVDACDVDGFDTLDNVWTLDGLGDADVTAMGVNGGHLELTGNGSSLFVLDDNAAFAHQSLTGDFRTELTITGFPIDQGGQVRKACLLLKGDLALRGPRAMACFIPHLESNGSLTTGLQFHYRDETGYADDWANLLQHIPLPMRFAITRQGDTLTVEYSRDDGATWTQPTGGAQGSLDIVLPDTVLVGPAVASYDAATPLTASFDDFAVCPVDEEVNP